MKGIKGGDSGRPPVQGTSNDWEKANDVYPYFDNKSSDMTSWRMLELGVVKKSPHEMLSGG